MVELRHRLYGASPHSSRNQQYAFIIVGKSGDDNEKYYVTMLGSSLSASTEAGMIGVVLTQEYHKCYTYLSQNADRV